MLVRLKLRFKPRLIISTGFAADSTRIFTNIAGVALFCSSARDNLILAQDAIIIQLQRIVDPAIQEQKLNEVMNFFSAELRKSGLIAHFDTAVAGTTITFGAGLAKKEDFLFNEGFDFLIAASFDASAAGSSTSFPLFTMALPLSIPVVIASIQKLLFNWQPVKPATKTQGNSPCASCHAQVNGTDHSPLKIGTCSDAEIVGALVAGSLHSGCKQTPTRSALLRVTDG